MSIGAQTAIPIEDGKAERIITDEQGNRTYLVEVIGTNPVRISHSKRYASDGTTLSAGQTHTISNLRGEELYAAGYQGDTEIRVREASADVTSQPVKEIDIGEVSVNSAIGIDAYTGPTLPVDPEATDPVTDSDSGTGAANAARVTLGSLRRRADIHVDTSGAATLTVEVSVDDQNWLKYETVSYSSATVEVEAFDVAFEYVRAYLDQNRNGITMSAKGE